MASCILRTLLCCSIACVCCFSTLNPYSALAAPLGDAAVNGGGSTLQVSTGNAVQAVCGNFLANGFGAVAGDNRPANNPMEDLFFRCNEMVQSANAVLNSGGTTNQLGLTAGQLATALQQLAGEENGSRGRAATESSNGQFANIGMRMNAIRQGARSSTGGLSLAGIDYLPETGELAFTGGGSAGDSGDGLGWGWYVNGAVGFGDRDATSREDPYDYDSYGLTIGSDYMFDNGLVLGGALGYSELDVDFDDASQNVLASTIAGGKIETESYSFSIYGVKDIGRFSVDAILTYGSSNFDLERVVRYQSGSGATGRGSGLVIDRTMRGDTDSTQWAGGVDATTTFTRGATDLDLNVGVNFLSIDVDGYTETDPAQNGGLNLQYDDQQIDSFQSILGFEIRHNISTRQGVVVPFLNVTWHHEFDNESEVLVARYANAFSNDPSLDLLARTDDPDEDFLDIGFGIYTVFGGNLQAFLDYRASAGLKHSTANLISFGIRGSF